MKDNAKGCSDALQTSTIEHISPSRLPLTLEFKPGIKAVQGIKLEMDTFGNYTLCYQVILQDKVRIFDSVKMIYDVTSIWRQ